MVQNGGKIEKPSISKLTLSKYVSKVKPWPTGRNGNGSSLFGNGNYIRHPNPKSKKNMMALNIIEINTDQ